MNRLEISILLTLTFLLVGTGIFSQEQPITESGGPLMIEQASYDVTYYLLDVKVIPENKYVQGKVMISARVGQPMYSFVLDLDTLLHIGKVSEIDKEGRERAREWVRKGGKIWIDLERTAQPGSQIEILVAYEGRPRVARRAPWDGGFTWSKTKDGQPWVTTSCQGEGADIWWPCKDHVSDEPDSMDLFVTVPGGLVAACNGRQIEKVVDESGLEIYHWFISNPINIYNVALNIAPYEVIKDSMDCIDGTRYPIEFYVLPQDKDKGLAFMPELKEHLNFHERHFGPYPFRADKYGVAQTPYLGMEHQSIIAFGSDFKPGSMIGKDFGFDELHHHELSHEWWGNMVTVADWKDAWIHEGFGTYSQALYMEEKGGFQAYVEYLSYLKRNSLSGLLVRGESSNTSEGWSGPIYNKGAAFLHTLRYLVGERELKRSLRFMAYPDQSLEKETGGKHCRFVNTLDFKNTIETYSEKDLGWVFDVYAYQPKLPKLHYERGKDYILVSWEVPDNLYFPMPVEVKVDKKLYKLDLKRGPARVKAKEKAEVVIDPNSWLMFDLVEKKG